MRKEVVGVVVVMLLLAIPLGAVCGTIKGGNPDAWAPYPCPAWATSVHHMLFGSPVPPAIPVSVAEQQHQHQQQEQEQKQQKQESVDEDNTLPQAASHTPLPIDDNSLREPAADAPSGAAPVVAAAHNEQQPDKGEPSDAVEGREGQEEEVQPGADPLEKVPPPAAVLPEAPVDTATSMPEPETEAAAETTPPPPSADSETSGLAENDDAPEEAAAAAAASPTSQPRPWWQQLPELPTSSSWSRWLVIGGGVALAATLVLVLLVAVGACWAAAPPLSPSGTDTGKPSPGVSSAADNGSNGSSSTKEGARRPRRSRTARGSSSTSSSSTTSSTSSGSHSGSSSSNASVSSPSRRGGGNRQRENTDMQAEEAGLPSLADDFTSGLHDPAVAALASSALGMPRFDQIMFLIANTRDEAGLESMELLVHSLRLGKLECPARPALVAAFPPLLAHNNPSVCVYVFVYSWRGDNH